MPLPIHLFNTMSRSLEQLKPQTDNIVRIYTCGPTVYSDLQLGNYRAYIIQDVLIKTLHHAGYTVDRVMNITDVGHLTSDQDEGEDKLEVGAKREGTTAWEVAKKYEQSFLKGMEELQIEIPSKLVRATDTITQQINFIQGLEEKGYTYTTEDGVYFDSSKVSDYGKLARLDIEGLQAGFRVAMHAEKKQATDFALWKFSPKDSKRDMEWESPWGKGFPGWHIECSAIALDQLGAELDIHCGGIDHIPVHHTNEIAQSESLTGKSLAHIWFHNEFLLVEGGKMAKSLGNGYTLTDLHQKRISPLAYRLFTYSASYRSKLNFTWEAIEAAQTSLTKLKALVASFYVEPTDQSLNQVGQSYMQRIEKALTTDLNMPEVLAVVWEALRSDLDAEQKSVLVDKLEPILSLGLTTVDNSSEISVPENIQQLLEKRNSAREQKNWSLADQLRGEIEQKGFQIIDNSATGESSLVVRK